MLAPPGQANYAAAKAAVVALTQSLAKEVARIGITVNAVCPGYVDTEALQGMTAEERQVRDLVHTFARDVMRPRQEMTVRTGVIEAPSFRKISSWSLWIGVPMMVTSGLLLFFPALASFLGFLVAARVTNRVGGLRMMQNGAIIAFIGTPGGPNCH